MHVTGDRIGDALIKWPVIRALKAALPDHRLVWVAGRRSSVFNGPLAELARGVIDEVHDEAGLATRWSEFFKPPYPGLFNIVIATETKLRTAWLLRRIRHDVFISPARQFRYSDRKPAQGFPLAAYEQFRCLAELAADRELAIERSVAVGGEREALAAALLPAAGGYVGFSPGAAGASKRWPLDRFVELARMQSERGRTPVFFLGPEEAALVDELRLAVPGALFPEQCAAAAGGGPLLTIALARRIDVSVANDSGGGHLLAAGGRRLLTLFGHTSPDKFRPPYGTRRVICARDFGATDMHAIPIAPVADALEQLLTEYHR